ncbi:MAG: hypothetical protein HW405_321 [Candidatus Berkelbacteria bacterium]|nr:hypothetical protein [Candidatus Berkelbacteria bacterium]
MTNKKLVGNQGEDIALRFLEAKGYILIKKNLHLKLGEIDLLMRDKDTLVLVEVKTKTDASFGRASDMITLRKQKKLIQLANCLWQKFPHKNIRIDVIAIDNNKIDHLVSAVEE